MHQKNLISLVKSCTNHTHLQQTFSQIQNPSTHHYNAMIRAYSMSDSPQQGLNMFKNMRQAGIFTDPLSLSFTIKCCIKLCSLTAGEQIHSRIWRDGFLSDTLLLTTLMDFYSTRRRIDEACKVFDELPNRDVVSWNVLISCYIRNRRTKDCLALFDRMRSEEEKEKECCKPDDVTCLHMLQACTSLGALEFGEGVHMYIEENGYLCSGKVCSSLISMYSRCGNVEKAYNVFKEMREKTLASWGAMISGLAMNGHGREAIKAFETMLRDGVKPDDHIFTGVLSGCSHCGMVDEGMMIFDRMTREFGISPNIHHYGCMVDLLGRANMLEKAYKLIMSMEVKPDATIWRTLLGACRIHRHFILGERILGHLIELKAQKAGDYVLLVNIYSSIGNWEKVSEIRKLMKDRGIQTTTGCSTIELKGVVHEFNVDDISHPQKDEIYKKLDEINKQLKIAGYVPEVSSELHNLHPNDKRYALVNHSEKLAMAFGVLVTPPGTTIRVANSCRLCIDCHSFSKFLSGVYNREVVIRDGKKFHHFREGRCSCNDYW